MFAEESHMPAVLGNPTDKSPVESDQANLEVILQNSGLKRTAVTFLTYLHAAKISNIKCKLC